MQLSKEYTLPKFVRLCFRYKGDDFWLNYKITVSCNMLEDIDFSNEKHINLWRCSRYPKTYVWNIMSSLDILDMKILENRFYSDV